MVATAPAESRVVTYANAVLDGEIAAGELVRKACERFFNDLATAEARGLRFHEPEAERVMGVLGQLKQSKGRWANKPLDLMPWQCFIIGQAFGWQIKRGQCAGCGSWLVVNPEGGTVGCMQCGSPSEPFISEPVEAKWLRRFRRVYIEIARKNTKTTTASGVAIVLLDFDKEPGAEVYAAATMRDQAKICWTESDNMRQRTPTLRSRIKSVPSTAHMYVEETSSKFAALGMDIGNKDGLNPHGTIIDELHAHRDRKLVDVLETAMGAREQPVIWYITTAGIAGESIYTETSDYARSVVEGTVEDDEWLVYIAWLDGGDDWTDPAVYIKSNPALGVTVQLEELIRERDRALKMPGRQNTFKRLRLNMRTEQAERWMDMDLWDACGEPFDADELLGRPCYAALDLASRRDFTALPLVFPMDDGTFQSLMFFWIPEQMAGRTEHDRETFSGWANEGLIKLTPGNVTDYDVVREDIRDLASLFDIREIAYDPWNATQLVNQLQEDGATCVEVRQGFGALSSPMKELEARIAGGRIRHGGNKVLRWMASNVAVRQDPAGNVKPDREKSGDKIDGIVALVMAIGRAMAGTDEGEAGVFFA